MLSKNSNDQILIFKKMPAGKGTYGSKKGRPKKEKKKMGPKGGGFSKLPKAVQNKILKKKK